MHTPPEGYVPGKQRVLAEPSARGHAHPGGHGAHAVCAPGEYWLGAAQVVVVDAEVEGHATPDGHAVHDPAPARLEWVGEEGPGGGKVTGPQRQRGTG